MWAKLATILAIFSLKRADLSIKDRNKLLIHIADKLGALPFRDMITEDSNGSLLVNGRPVDIELARILRDSAKGALHSKAFTYIRDQVLYDAIKLGVHRAEDEKQMY